MPEARLLSIGSWVCHQHHRLTDPEGVKLTPRSGNRHTDLSPVVDPEVAHGRAPAPGRKSVRILKGPGNWAPILPRHSVRIVLLAQGALRRYPLVKATDQKQLCTSEELTTATFRWVPSPAPYTKGQRSGPTHLGTSVLLWTLKW